MSLGTKKWNSSQNCKKMSVPYGYSTQKSCGTYSYQISTQHDWKHWELEMALEWKTFCGFRNFRKILPAVENCGYYYDHVKF